MYGASKDGSPSPGSSSNGDSSSRPMSGTAPANKPDQLRIGKLKANLVANLEQTFGGQTDATDEPSEAVTSTSVETSSVPVQGNRNQAGPGNAPPLPPHNVPSGMPPVPPPVPPPAPKVPAGGSKVANKGVTSTGTSSQRPPKKNVEDPVAQLANMFKDTGSPTLRPIGSRGGPVSGQSPDASGNTLAHQALAARSTLRKIDVADSPKKSEDSPGFSMPTLRKIGRPVKPTDADTTKEDSQ